MKFTVKKFTYCKQNVKLDIYSCSGVKTLQTHKISAQERSRELKEDLRQSCHVLFDSFYKIIFQLLAERCISWELESIKRFGDTG